MFGAVFISQVSEKSYSGKTAGSAPIKAIYAANFDSKEEHDACFKNVVESMLYAKFGSLFLGVVEQPPELLTPDTYFCTVNANTTLTFNLHCVITPSSWFGTAKAHTLDLGTFTSLPTVVASGEESLADLYQTRLREVVARTDGAKKVAVSCNETTAVQTQPVRSPPPLPAVPVVRASVAALAAQIAGFDKSTLLTKEQRDERMARVFVDNPLYSVKSDTDYVKLDSSAESEEESSDEESSDEESSEEESSDNSSDNSSDDSSDESTYW